LFRQKSAKPAWCKTRHPWLKQLHHIIPVHSRRFFVAVWVVLPNFSLNNDNNPADYCVIFDILGNLAQVYFVVGCYVLAL
jgi:hypothetical protein